MSESVNTAATAATSPSSAETTTLTEGAAAAAVEAQADTPEAKAAEEAEAADKAKRDSAQKRIDKAIRSQREAERRAEAKDLENQALLKRLEAADPEKAAARMAEEEIDRRAEAKAKQLLAQRDAAQKINAFDANGRQECGDDWDDKCNTIAELGANKRPDFVPVIADIENGHRAVAHLAEDTDLLEKILAMPPHKMAIELAKLADKPLKAAPKKQISNAPEPIKPVTGNNKGDGHRPGMSMDEYVAWRDKNAPVKR